MSNRISLTIRMIPLALYCLLLFGLIFRIDRFEVVFNFWSPMINFPADLFSWFLAGVYIVILCLVLALIRLFIIRFSFSSLNRKIPHNNTWENIQLFLMLFNILVPIIIGLLYSFKFIDVDTFQLSLGIWIVINFIPDFGYYIWWIINGN